MHYITHVEYDSGFKLYLQFEDGGWRIADLKEHLSGEVFEPLRELSFFQTAVLNSDIDTVVWENGADMSPDFLYEISQPVEGRPQLKAAEESVSYKTDAD
jgi:hypothetical protein